MFERVVYKAVTDEKHIATLAATSLNLEDDGVHMQAMKEIRHRLIAELFYQLSPPPAHPPPLSPQAAPETPPAPKHQTNSVHSLLTYLKHRTMTGV